MKRNKKSFEGYRANKNERPLTIAHRGASALAEHENTLEVVSDCHRYWSRYGRI